MCETDGSKGKAKHAKRQILGRFAVLVKIVGVDQEFR